MINPGTQRLNGAKKLLLAGVGIAALAGPVVVGLAVGFLMAAYGVGSDYISGPAWLDASPPQFYAIEATIRPGATKEQASRMLQNLPTQRFQLTMHRETRDVPLFELTVAGKGPQLEEYVADSHAANGGGFVEGVTHQNASDGMNHAVANKVSIAQLINFLSFQLKRPVVGSALNVCAWVF